MNIQIEDVGPCRKQISIEVPADKVAETFQQVASGYAKYARIPGFRPGKAPKDLVKRRYAKEILKDVKEQLIPEGYHAALTREKIRTVQVVDVTEADPKDGEPYGFQVTVDVFPEFTLPDYKAIKVEEKPVEVTEESINEVIDNMRDRMASYEDAPGKVAAEGDRVVVNYTGTIDGEPMEPLVGEHRILAVAEAFGVILDENYSFIPEFAKQLAGAKAGETREIEASFDAGFVVAGIAGKTALYKVEVLGVEQKKLPELDDAFLKTMGAETVEALRERVSADLKRMKTDQERRRVQDEICRQLLDGTDLHLPESEVQRRTADEVYDLVQYNTMRGIDRDNIEQNREKIFELAGKTAQEKLKLRYILLRIAEEEKMAVSDAEVQARIGQLAVQARKDPAKLKRELEENNRIGMLRDDMLAGKMLDQILSSQVAAPAA